MTNSNIRLFGGGYSPYAFLSQQEVIAKRAPTDTRAEARLPMLYERAKQAGKQWEEDLRSVAAAAAEFTYGSIARQFLPHSDDHVGAAPAFINRDPKFELSGATLQLTDLTKLRAEQIEAKRLQHAGQRKGSYNSQVLSCEELGIMYRGAELASKDWPVKFTPTAASLIGFKADEKSQCVNPLPASLMPYIQEVERSVRSKVYHIQAER